MENGFNEITPHNDFNKRSISTIEWTKEQKKFNPAIDRRDNEKLMIAIKIKGYREISRFASDCGFSRSFISKIIHRQINPTLEQAQIITSKLNVSIFDVFEITDIRNLKEVENDRS